MTLDNVQYDAYFFGVGREEKLTTLDYKIADFDNIITNSEVTFKQNLDEFVRAFHLFLDYFVDDMNRSIYVKEVNRVFKNG